MRRGVTFILLAMTLIVAGCAGSSAPPNTTAPKEGTAAPAAKPSPSANDPAIKPPTKEHE